MYLTSCWSEPIFTATKLEWCCIEVDVYPGKFLRCVRIWPQKSSSMTLESYLGSSGPYFFSYIAKRTSHLMVFWPRTPRSAKSLTSMSHQKCPVPNTAHILPTTAVCGIKEIFFSQSQIGNSTLKHNFGVSLVAQHVKNSTGIHEEASSIPDLFRGLRTWHCCGLWCRSQTRLESCIAVAVAVPSCCSSSSTPGLGTSTCHKGGSQQQKFKKYLKSK